MSVKDEKASGLPAGLATPFNTPFQLSVNMASMSKNSEPRSSERTTNTSSSATQLRYSIAVNAP